MHVSWSQRAIIDATRRRHEGGLTEVGFPKRHCESPRRIGRKGTACRLHAQSRWQHSTAPPSACRESAQPWYGAATPSIEAQPSEGSRRVSKQHRGDSAHVHVGGQKLTSVQLCRPSSSRSGGQVMAGVSARSAVGGGLPTRPNILRIASAFEEHALSSHGGDDIHKLSPPGFRSLAR